MRLLKNNNFLGGMLCGLGIMLACLLAYRKIFPEYYTIKLPSYVIDSSLSKKKMKDVEEKITEFKLAYSTLEERISSTNKRLDDLFIFGGIIITLLLAINVSVYIKAEGEVEKHFKQNFEIHKQTVEGLVNEMERKAASVQSSFDLVNKLRNSIQEQKTPEP